MKTLNATIPTLALAAMALLGAACEAEDRGAASLAPSSHPTGGRVQTTHDVTEKKMRIKIGSKTFTAALEDNPAVVKLKEALPLTLKMAELNGNEKHADLPTALPTDPKNPGTIQAGDLLLYGDDTLVLFYRSFKTSYSYTRLGKIEDPSGLEAAVGAGHVSVSFEIK